MATSENTAALRTFGEGTLDDVPGRFSAHAELSGDVAEAEHLARYRWAAGLAAGRRVLDAGCGWAYGTLMMAEAGAAKATGIDLAPTVIEVAQQELGDRVDLHVGDVNSLPFPDHSFDMVVCFEVIEHVEERAAVIAELRRVLTEDGILVISSPNRNRSVPGNPYHVHEYTPPEFREELGAQFPHVEVFQQHVWLVSAVIDAEAAATGALTALEPVHFAKGVAHAPETEDYMIAVASGKAVAVDATATAVATSDVELRRWLSLYEEQDTVLKGQSEYFDSLDLARVGEMAKELEDAAASESRLLERVAQLEEALEISQATIARADRVREEIFSSLSWRITAPLRKLKG